MEEESDWTGLSEEDQEKLAGYDLLEMDTRFAARRLCLSLQRYQGQIPQDVANDIRKILDELLLRHLLAKDRAWWAEMVKKLEAV
jgi:hypothetical protein